MKPDKKNIKEPFAPEQTPQPPQIIEPASEKERTTKKGKVDDGVGKDKSENKK